MTPTECFAALKAGADGAEAFPRQPDRARGAEGDPRRAAEGLQVYAVGGAGRTNFAEWVKAGANGFGIGTALYTPGCRWPTWPPARPDRRGL
jgi:2-dehydro-3-deoxyphosphogalactonate aldolase